MMIDFGPEGDYIARLHERMAERRITRAMLSRETSFAASTLTRWFNTDVRPSMDNIVELERGFLSLARTHRKLTPKEEV
jgi:hypothetical protein